jgi:hypothetical protein
VATPPDPKQDLAAAFGRRVPHHSHSLGLIQIYLRVVLCCAVGFRGAAAVLQVAALLFPTDEQAPSPNGGQMWLLRLGLYMLSRPKELADDWVWIIDHTIQIGPLKCLVVVGVRLSAWEAKRADQDQSSALAHHDLSAWLIKPMAHSDGEAVHAELRDLSQKTGVVPCEIASDCGGDLEKGISLFCSGRPTRRVKDIAHAAANAVKRELNGNVQWEAFLREASQAKAKMRQTKLAFLLPPELKAKARWMNLDALVSWSRKAVGFVQAPRPVPGVSWEDDELEEKMGWIRGYQDPLAAWSQMLEVVATVLTYAREHGYHLHAKQELQNDLSCFTAQAETPACRVAERLLAFVEEESAGIAAGRRFVASSEVLESLIGKAKQLEGSQSKGGFTKTVLGLAASVAKVTEQNIRAALTATKVQDVINWVREHLGTSLEAQRHHAFKPQPPGTKLASTVGGLVS